MNIMKHMVHDERDILLTGEKREGSRTMEEKVGLRCSLFRLLHGASVF